MKETELAKKVISWLKDYNWDIYQEVPIKDRVADIVAVQNNLIWIIETKLSLNLKVIAQADYYKRYAHFVSIATLPPKKGISSIISEILVWKKIGYISVGNSIFEGFPAILNRNISKIQLFDEQKHYSEAGNNEGKRYTPFKNTCKEVIRVVSNNQGILFKDLINNIKHHYRTPSTAKNCIKKWIELGYIENIIIIKENNRLVVYYKEE